MSNASLPGDLKPLPEALRLLPQLAPGRSAWPELAAALQRDAAAGNGESRSADRRSPLARRRPRWFVPATLAAGIAVAAFAALLHRHEPPAPRAPGAATVAQPAASIVANAPNATNAANANAAAVPAAQLAALQERSQALEHWLHETSAAAAPLRGQDLAAATELEDMIGLVDVQLNAAPRNGEVTLWQRRVALLEDLTALRWSSYSLAETGATPQALTPAALTN